MKKYLGVLLFGVVSILLVGCSKKNEEIVDSSTQTESKPSTENSATTTTEKVTESTTEYSGNILDEIFTQDENGYFYLSQRSDGRIEIDRLTDLGKQQEVLVIPEYCDVVGLNSICDNDVLREVTFENPNTEINSYAFFGCENLETIVLPENLEKISNGAFSGCKSLKEIIIPDSVTYIGESAFQKCESLVSITIGSNVTEIDEGAFFSCYSLETVELNANITTLKEGTFSHCRSLSTIVLPDTVETIEKKAFGYDTGLISVTCGSKLKLIENEAFLNCSNLENVDYNEGVEVQPDAFSGCTSLKN